MYAVETRLYALNNLQGVWDFIAQISETACHFNEYLRSHERRKPGYFTYLSRLADIAGEFLLTIQKTKSSESRKGFPLWAKPGEDC